MFSTDFGIISISMLSDTSVTACSRKYVEIESENRKNSDVLSSSQIGAATVASRPHTLLYETRKHI